MIRIAISFDYDSPAGYRESFHMQDVTESADYEGTSILLDVLRKHDVKVTFGVVGEVALPGKPPANCQEQIQAIHRAGHEIASHSMTHQFLPPLRDSELEQEAVDSKRSLESCIGAAIEGFIPPFNRPSHFPRGGAFSISEIFGLAGRGRGRQSISTMLLILGKSGFAWSRVSYRNTLLQLGRSAGLVAPGLPMQPFLHHGVVAIPLHETGFGERARSLVQRWKDSDLVLTLYGHPSQALVQNDQSAKELDGLFVDTSAMRRQGKLEFNTMREIAALARAEGVPLRREILV